MQSDFYESCGTSLMAAVMNCTDWALRPVPIQDYLRKL